MYSFVWRYFLPLQWRPIWNAALIYAAFHLGLHCLQKYLVRGFPNTNSWSVGFVYLSSNLITYQIHQTLHCIFMTPDTLARIKAIRHGETETEKISTHLIRMEFPVLFNKSNGPVCLHCKRWWVVIFIFIQTLIGYFAGKQWRPRSDATICCIWSGSALFAYVSQNGHFSFNLVNLFHKSQGTKLFQYFTCPAGQFSLVMQTHTLFSFKSVCNKEHKGVICYMTSSSNSSQSTRPTVRVLWEELLIFSRFHS